MSTTPLTKIRVPVLGHEMAVHDSGPGDASTTDTFLFLHGNPTSSYLWRDVLPHVADLGRVVAPDLIGHGDSDKLADSGPDRYTFAEHSRYLDAVLDALDLGDRITLVIHDWGSALGFDWARRHPDRIAGIAYMEGIVAPVTWADWPESARRIFQGMRSEAGEEMVLTKNLFVEAILPASILRPLDAVDMDEYRRPFATPGEDRRPTLTWPRQIPVEGSPADVVALVEDYGRWMAHTTFPKLFVNADPGSILVGTQREFCRTWPNQREVTVAGLHFVQEDSADEIGGALRDWYLDEISRPGAG